MNLCPRGNQNQEVSTNPDKRRSLSGITEYSSLRTSIRRKTDACHGVIDLEKPTTSGDVVEVVDCSGFGNLSNHNGRAQDGSCCISPENSSLVDSARLRRDWNSSRVSLGSVGSSNTPDCQSPIKTSNTESRHSLIDLNVPQEESLVISSTLFHSSSTYPGIFAKNPREVSEKECGCGIGSMRGSSITAITPNSVADCLSDVVAAESSVERKHLFDLNEKECGCGIGSMRGSSITAISPNSVADCLSDVVAAESSVERKHLFDLNKKECGCGIGSMRGSSIMVVTPNSVADCLSDVVAAESSVERKDLFDLNVSLESIDMPSEMINDCRDKVVNNYVSKGSTHNHSFSMKKNQQAETSTKYVVLENHHMSACKDDNNVLLPTPTNNGITKVQSPEYGTINKEILIPEYPLVDNNAPPRLRISQNGASNLQELSMLRDKANDDDTAASIAARTLLSIFQHNSACTADFPGSSSQAAAQNANDEPQPSLNSFEKIVLNLEEIEDDGQSINLTPPDNEGPACGIKLKRGRAMRNFQREIIPRLVFLPRQEVCEDLQAIGYEPKKTRSRKTRKDQGAPSTRAMPRKRGAAKN